MAAAAQPKSAELPLPGGREGATLRLHPLLCGQARWPEAWPHRTDGPLARLRALGLGTTPGNWVRLPIVAFLVEHPEAGPILIDTGLDPSVSVDRKKNFGQVLGRIGGGTTTTEPQQAVPVQLRERGVDPTSVRLVVMTHLHYDHASGMSQFPDATFVVSTHEWEAADNTALGVLHGYVRGQFEGLEHVRTVDFEGPDTESYEGFGAALDLLGDGSIRVVSTPGHTHGHMSAVLRTHSREILVAGDAVYTRHTLETGHLPAYMEDPHLFGRSLKQIQLYAQRNPDALVIPGHDMEAWQELAPMYE